MAGPDFMEKMFELTSDGSLSHSIFGSTEETLAGLKEKSRKKKISGALTFADIIRLLSEMYLIKK